MPDQIAEIIYALAEQVASRERHLVLLRVPRAAWTRREDSSSAPARRLVETLGAGGVRAETTLVSARPWKLTEAYDCYPWNAGALDEIWAAIPEAERADAGRNRYEVWVEVREPLDRVREALARAGWMVRAGGGAP